MALAVVLIALLISIAVIHDLQVTRHGSIPRLASWPALAVVGLLAGYAFVTTVS